MPNTFDPTSAQQPTSNTDAVCTMATPPVGTRWRIRQIRCNYLATPSSLGQVVIAWAEGGNNYTESFSVLVAGQTVIDYKPAKSFPTNAAVTVTLKAATTTGSVFVDADTGIL